MSLVFADTAFWVALTSPRDSLHHMALAASRQLQDTQLVTTEPILTEFLNAFCELGPYWRREAVRRIQQSCPRYNPLTMT